VRALWKKIRYRFEWFWLVSATKLVPLLPRHVCFHLANALGDFVASLDRAGRKVARSNLQAVFGETLCESDRGRIARQSYRQVVRTMLDLCWSPRLTKENFNTYVEIVGAEEAWADIRSGRGIIFTTFHYGNFEGAALALGLHGQRGLALAQEFKNPLLEPVFAWLRKHSGNKVTPRDGGIIRMYKALRRGDHVALLTDFTLKADEPGVAINCFGMKKYATFAHAWLHQRTGAPIVAICCRPLSGGRYRLELLPKLEFKKGTSLIEITQGCWDQLEPFVRQNPGPWMWMYKHWRYRLPGSAKPYPYYAEIGPAFETRLNESMEKLAQEKI
jgi:Kdo2-lipid IVA lauroyltransferase/acyltransferase